MKATTIPWDSTQEDVFTGLNFILKLLSIRERDNGKIIRACDDEPGTMYEYHKCYESGKPHQLIQVPTRSIRVPQVV